MDTQRPRAQAFGLIEWLVLVALLMVLAAIAFPSLSSASERSRGRSRLSDLTVALQTVRSQLSVYRKQHGGSWPSRSSFVEQMTLYTDKDGLVSPIRTDRFCLGPYLSVVPDNVFTGSNDVVNEPLAASSDWFFDEQTGQFQAHNSPEHAAM